MGAASRRAHRHLARMGRRQMLYGKDAAAMYDEAAALQKSARETFYKASDAFFKANAAASYNDWKRARAHWDYFYGPCPTTRNSNESLSCRQQLMWGGRG